MIHLQNVSKFFGAREAVHDLTLTVPAGEIFGLLGHNGAGKSTAIGMMLGQVWPTRGEVKVCGHEVASHRALALKRVGAIFEAPAFYDYLTGWRNLEILSHYSAPTSKERIREVVDWVGLTGREQSKVKTYSHGMMARLALAQALVALLRHGLRSARKFENEADNILRDQKHAEPDVGPFFAKQFPKFVFELGEKHRVSDCCAEPAVA